MGTATCTLYDTFYREFFLSIAISVILFLLAVFIVAAFIDHRKTMNKIFKAASIAVSTVLVVAICVGGVVVSKHPKDFKYLDENAPLQVEGEVIRIDTNAQHPIYQRTRVIISVSGTGEITELELRHADQRVDVGETYSFLYLPNTRIAEVIENEP